jgi:hypothetical protein
MPVFAAQPDRAVLNRALQAHVASRQAGQRQAVAGTECENPQVLLAGELACDPLPPVFGAPPAVAEHHDAARTIAGAADGLLVGQADAESVDSPRPNASVGEAFSAKASRRIIMRSPVSDGWRAMVSAWSAK